MAKQKFFVNEDELDNFQIQLLQKRIGKKDRLRAGWIRDFQTNSKQANCGGQDGDDSHRTTLRWASSTSSRKGGKSLEGTVYLISDMLWCHITERKIRSSNRCNLIPV